MKIKIIAYAIMNLCIIHVAAQKIKSTQVPLAVQNAFSKQFPKTNVNTWELEDKNYEAHFDVKGMDWSVQYDPEGDWMETEQEIHAADIPSAVNNSILNSFAGYKSSEMDKVTKKNGLVTFEIVLQKGTKTIEVVFDPSGKLLSTENTKDEKD